MIYFLLFNFYIYFLNIKRKDISLYVVGYTPAETPIQRIEISDIDEIITPLTNSSSNNNPLVETPIQRIEISDIDELITPLTNSSSLNEQNIIQREEIAKREEFAKKFKEQKDHLFEYEHIEKEQEIYTVGLYYDKLKKDNTERIKLLEDFPEASKQQFLMERNIFFISSLAEYYKNIHTYISDDIKPKTDQLSDQLEEELKTFFKKFSDIKEIFNIEIFLQNIKSEIDQLYPSLLSANSYELNKKELLKIISGDFNDVGLNFQKDEYNVIKKDSENYIINIQKSRIEELKKIISLYQYCIKYENIETIKKLEYIKKMYFKFIYIIQLLSQNENENISYISQYSYFLGNYTDELSNLLRNLDTNNESIKQILETQKEKIKKTYNDISEDYRNKLISELDITLLEKNQEILINNFFQEQKSFVNKIYDIYISIQKISILVKHLEDNKNLKGFVEKKMKEFISEYKSFQIDKKDYELYFKDSKTNLELEKKNKIDFFSKETKKLENQKNVLNTEVELLKAEVTLLEQTIQNSQIDQNLFFIKKKELKDKKTKLQNKTNVLKQYKEFSEKKIQQLREGYSSLETQLSNINNEIDFCLRSSIDQINSNFQNNFDKQMINFTSKLSWEQITETNVPYYISRIQNEVKRKIDEHLIHLRNVKIDFLEKMTYMILDYEIKRIDTTTF